MVYSIALPSDPRFGQRLVNAAVIDNERPKSTRRHIVALIAIGALVAVIASLVSTAQADGPWHDESRSHRFDLSVDPQGVNRTDLSVVASVNFTQALTEAGDAGQTFDVTSIRVMEVNGAGALIDGSVPFQFDQGSGYNPTTNAVGELVLLLEGSTTATRRYHVYFRSLTSPGSTWDRGSSTFAGVVRPFGAVWRRVR